MKVTWVPEHTGFNTIFHQHTVTFVCFFTFLKCGTEHTAGPGWEGRKGILVLTQRTGKTGLALAAPWAHLILPQGP